MTSLPAKEPVAVISAPPTTDPTLERLEDEIRWYDAKSTRCQRMFKWLKLIEIMAAASIPVLGAFHAPIEAGAVLGAVIVVLEGLQHVNQYQSNWISYRATCEGLKHEKYLYLAHAGPYAGDNAHSVLAERIEGLISQEESKWVTAHEQPVQTTHKADSSG